MVCPGVLIGLFLFSLTSSGVSAVEVDQNTLAKIIQFIDKKYQPPGQTEKGDRLQYAVAIKVPKEKCLNEFKEDDFLKEEKDVKKALKDMGLYEGKQLVAALPSNTGHSNAVHSERALLMCEDNNHADTPVRKLLNKDKDMTDLLNKDKDMTDLLNKDKDMTDLLNKDKDMTDLLNKDKDMTDLLNKDKDMKDLLNKDKDSCVVFYTYNSPCLKLCLNQAKDDELREGRDKKIEKKRPNIPPLVQKCILKSLGVLTDHGGPKAFVFSRVYDEDLGSATRAAALKVVAEKVPLYKCDAGSCVKCLSNGQIIDECSNVKV